jgi:signal transduction histidine kinase
MTISSLPTGSHAVRDALEIDVQRHAQRDADNESEDEADDVSRHLRTDFLRRVAHDIASPTGVTLTVLDELASPDEPRPELAAMARRSLRRLMRLSEQLALAAELEGGELEPELASLDVRTLVRKAVEEAVAIDGRKDVVASCEGPLDPVPLRGDPRLLGTVLREVVGNALKLATSKVSLTVKTSEGRAIIRIDDDGPGFTEKAVENLGRRFVDRPARGLGLSLSMGIDILRVHGGTLELEASQLPPGRRGTAGAAVVITMPLAR